MLGEPSLRPIRHGLEDGDGPNLGRRKAGLWKDSAILFYAFSDPGKANLGTSFRFPVTSNHNGICRADASFVAIARLQAKALQISGIWMLANIRMVNL